jgi:hypothetical protein
MCRAHNLCSTESARDFQGASQHRGKARIRANHLLPNLRARVEALTESGRMMRIESLSVGDLEKMEINKTTTTSISFSLDYEERQELISEIVERTKLDEDKAEDLLREIIWKLEYYLNNKD